MFTNIYLLPIRKKIMQNKRGEIDRRNFLRISAGACALAASVALGGCDAYDTYSEVVTGERTITDHAGRELTIPVADDLKGKIYFTSGLAQVWIFSLNPDLQGGSSAQFTDEQLEFLPEGIDQLPYMGSISENGQIDREMLLSEGIKLIFSISGVGLTESNISDAETLQNQTNIPVVLIDGSFDKIADSYRFVGEIVGEEDRAEELATYCEQKYAEVTEALKPLKEDEKISLYYAEGPDGLQTEPDSSQHALTFKIAGANNVAKVEEVPEVGMSSVDMERVMKWNPEVIVAWDEEDAGGADQYIRESEDWANIKAVKDGRVYTMPHAPFAWCDRPPGVNRLIGIQWIANLLYPQYYNIDMVEETKNFYKTMYWADITDEQAIKLLGNSYKAKE